MSSSSQGKEDTAKALGQTCPERPMTRIISLHFSVALLQFGSLTVHVWSGSSGSVPEERFRRLQFCLENSVSGKSVAWVLVACSDLVPAPSCHLPIMPCHDTLPWLASLMHPNIFY